MLSTSVCAWKNNFEPKIPIIEKIIALHKNKNIPELATLFALSNCFAPNERESNAFIPTAVPPQTAIINCCNGNASETAFSASSPNWDTKTLSTTL